MAEVGGREGGMVGLEQVAWGGLVGERRHRRVAVGVGRVLLEARINCWYTSAWVPERRDPCVLVVPVSGQVQPMVRLWRPAKVDVHAGGSRGRLVVVAPVSIPRAGDRTLERGKMHSAHASPNRGRVERASGRPAAVRRSSVA